MAGLSSTTIFSRKLLHDDSNSGSSAAVTCPALPTPIDDADKVVGSFTVHQVLLVIGAASAIIATTVSLLLFFLHAFNVRRPQEQIKIMRIITFLPVFSLIALVNIAIGQSAIFLVPWANFYESICLCTFYLLVHAYIAPTVEGQAAFFAHLPLKSKEPSDKNCSAFWRRTQLTVFQAIPIEFIIAIATDISQAVGTYCINSNKVHFAHIWLSILHTISTAVSVMSLIRLTYRLKPEFPQIKLAMQLWAFKAIVGLSTLQSFVFSIVAGQAHSTTTLSYNDISIGIPNTLLAVETVGFAIFFHFAYGWRRYSAGGVGALTLDGQKQQQVAMGAFTAIFRALIPLDVFAAMFQIFTGRWSIDVAPESHSQMEPLHAEPNPYQVNQRWPAASPREDPQAYEGHTHYGSNAGKLPDYQQVHAYNHHYSG